jgi:hypothetical protein
MKSRPGQGLTEISKKIRLRQNDHASRRTQRSRHTRRRPKPPKPLPQENAENAILHLPSDAPPSDTPSAKSKVAFEISWRVRRHSRRHNAAQSCPPEGPSPPATCNSHPAAHATNTPTASARSAQEIALAHSGNARSIGNGNRPDVVFTHPARSRINLLAHTANISVIQHGR